MKMLPVMEDKYGMDMEIISRPRADYSTEEYVASGLPPAPAIMVGNVLIAQGPGITKCEIEKEICRRLNRPVTEPKIDVIFD